MKSSSKSDHADVHGQKAQVQGLFARIASDYDFLNHGLSMGLDIHWRRVLVRGALPANPPSGQTAGWILDLAAGTFDVSLSLARAYPQARILAADLCFPMLRKGLPKLAKARVKGKSLAPVLPVQADGFSLPLSDGSLAAITIAFGLRNMLPRVEALAEARRVLAPGGRLSVLEFGSARRKVWLGLYNFYLSAVLPRLGGWVSGERTAYEYLARTVRDFPSAEELAGEMSLAGFAKVEYDSLCGGIVYLHRADKAQG